MALIEGCKHSLEITVPVEDVEAETNRVVESLKEKVRLPGFRHGKVPATLIRSKFSKDIRQEVLEALIPKHLRQEVENNNLPLVGSPDITDIKFEKGEPLRFKAIFEVAPEFDLEEYHDITVTYQEPEVTEEELAQRLEQLREQKAEYIDVDPRPVADGDYAVIALHSVSGVEGAPITQDELVLHAGGEDTLDDFTTNLLGMEPGEEKEFDVSYPEDYAQERLGGKTVRFHVALKVIRRKELPELNDEFSKDLGDYQNLEELREAVRSSMRGEREFLAQQQAKNELVDKLVEMHDFPIPETYLERQIESIVEQRMREMVDQGIDPRNLKLDWQKVKESQKDRATHDVKASLLLARIADREVIEVTTDELDQQVRRIAHERREPVAAVRAELEKDEELPRIASHIRTEKTLNFLFEQARKVAPEENK